MKNKEFYENVFLKYDRKSLFKKYFRSIIKKKKYICIIEDTIKNFYEILNIKTKNQIENSSQEELIDLNQKKSKKRGRRKKLDKNKSSEDKVIHDKNEKWNIIDKIIRKYNYFLTIYLNSILEENKIKESMFNKIVISSGYIKIDKIIEFLESKISYTVISDRTKIKNYEIIKAITEKNDKKFEEIKEILNKTNSDIYENIFLKNHAVKLKNEKEISYNSILNSIEEENGPDYKNKFDDYARNIMKIIKETKKSTREKHKLQIENINNENNTKIKFLGKKTGRKSNLLLESQE